MTIGQLARQFQYPLVGALLLVGSASAPVLAQAQAQDDHMHSMPSQYHEQTPEQKKKANALVKVVRDLTSRFQDPTVAEGEDYKLKFGCVSGSDFGAMGLHYVNLSLVDGELDLYHPEIVLYEPLPNGKLRLTGADYVVLADDWNSTHADPPELMGQLFHRFDSPNRFELPAFYTLHVWAWKDNPNGTFTNWNPDVSCDGFAGQNP